MEFRVKSLGKLAAYFDKLAKEHRERAAKAKTEKEKDRLNSVAAAYENSSMVVSKTVIVPDGK